jgi:hypothetical protein
MSFDEEWAQLQAVAREQVAHTRLNSTGDGDAGGSADLEVTDKELEKIEDTANGLANALDQSGHEAENHTHVAGIYLRTPGFECGQVLIDVATQWASQAETLRDACLRIANHLRDTAAEFAAAEEEAGAGMRHAQSITYNRSLSAL